MINGSKSEPQPVALNPNQALPENGNGGAANGVGEAEVEEDMDGAQQAPEPVEENALVDELDDEDDDDDDDLDVDEDDDFVDEEV